MPWMETGAMEQKVEFILAWKKSELSMAALCRSFGISRQTGYKWVSRFYEDGDEGDFRALGGRENFGRGCLRASRITVRSWCSRSQARWARSSSGTGSRRSASAAVTRRRGRSRSPR